MEDHRVEAEYFLYVFLAISCWVMTSSHVACRALGHWVFGDADGSALGRVLPTAVVLRGCCAARELFLARESYR